MYNNLNTTSNPSINDDSNSYDGSSPLRSQQQPIVAIIDPNSRMSNNTQHARDGSPGSLGSVSTVDIEVTGADTRPTGGIFNTDRTPLLRQIRLFGTGAPSVLSPGDAAARIDPTTFSNRS